MRIKIMHAQCLAHGRYSVLDDEDDSDDGDGDDGDCR